MLTPPTFVVILLWIVKIVGTIWLLMYYTKEYAKEFELFTYSNGFQFATLTSVLSAFFTGCYFFLHYALLFPGDIDVIAESINQAMSARGVTDSSTIDTVLKYFPHLLFIIQLIYLSIFGVIVSSIIANFTKKGDIFSTPNQQ